MSLELHQGGSGIPCAMRKKTRAERASYGNGASRVEFASRMECPIHLRIIADTSMITSEWLIEDPDGRL